MAKPVTITIPPFVTDEGDFPAFWAWTAIVLIFLFYGALEIL